MLIDTFALSQRVACRIVGISRSTFRRCTLKDTPRDPNRWLREKLREYSNAHPCHGFKRAHAWLVHDEGVCVNRKKVQRLWREESLTRPQMRRRKRTDKPTSTVERPTGPNQVWSIDFQFDTTSDGRFFKIASMIDEYTRESLLDLVDRSITADELCTALAKVCTARGTPSALRMDNGPEFISKRLKKFCSTRISMAYIEPGTPWNNGVVESFNRRRRYECLALNEFTSVLEARVAISDFHADHNHHHRHSALGYLTPTEYAATLNPTTPPPSKNTLT